MDPFWDHFGGVLGSLCYASTAHAEFAENLEKNNGFCYIFACRPAENMVANSIKN